MGDGAEGGSGVADAIMAAMLSVEKENLGAGMGAGKVMQGSVLADFGRGDRRLNTTTVRRPCHRAGS